MATWSHPFWIIHRWFQEKLLWPWRQPFCHGTALRSLRPDLISSPSWETPVSLLPKVTMTGGNRFQLQEENVWFKSKGKVTNEGKQKVAMGQGEQTQHVREWRPAPRARPCSDGRGDLSSPLSSVFLWFAWLGTAGGAAKKWPWKTVALPL